MEGGQRGGLRFVTPSASKVPGRSSRPPARTGRFGPAVAFLAMVAAAYLWALTLNAIFP